MTQSTTERLTELREQLPERPGGRYFARLIDILRDHFQPQPASGPTKFHWLIEAVHDPNDQPQPLWLACKEGWTTDANAALKFASKAEAQAFAYGHKNRIIVEKWKATEHWQSNGQHDVTPGTCYDLIAEIEPQAPAPPPADTATCQRADNVSGGAGASTQEKENETI